MALRLGNVPQAGSGNGVVNDSQMSMSPSSSESFTLVDSTATTGETQSKTVPTPVTPRFMVGPVPSVLAAIGNVELSQFGPAKGFTVKYGTEFTMTFSLSGPPSDTIIVTRALGSSAGW